MTILDAIDTTKDNKIELQELEKALDEGFFDNEENLLQIKKNLEENAAGELVESLKITLNSAIKEILIQEDFSINDLRIIELWNTLLGNTDEENREKITSSMEKKKLDFMYNFSFNELQNLSVQKKQKFYEKFYIISSIISGDLETVNTEEINKGNIDLFFVNSLYEEWKITKSKELEAKVTTNVEDIVKKYVLDKKQSGLIGGQYDFTAFEIYLIQLLAKMQGEEIEIDGSRARVNVQIGDKYILLPTINYNLYEKYNPKDFNEMAWKTNVWIFRQELKGLFGYIEDGEFVMSDFFEEQLKSIPDIDIQNKVLSTFGENIKEIRTHGKFYSKNQRDGLKDYFSLLVSIELETDENIKKELIKESKDKIVKIKSNVQESVTKDKGFVLNEYKSKIATTEDGEILGFVEGTTKADVEKMLTFISYDWNLKYINSNYPEFKTDLFKAIVESEFYNELKDKNSGIKEIYDNKLLMLEKKEQIKNFENMQVRVQTILDIVNELTNFLMQTTPSTAENYSEYFNGIKDQIKHGRFEQILNMSGEDYLENLTDYYEEKKNYNNILQSVDWAHFYVIENIESFLNKLIYHTFESLDSNNTTNPKDDIDNCIYKILFSQGMGSAHREVFKGFNYSRDVMLPDIKRIVEILKGEDKKFGKWREHEYFDDKIKAEIAWIFNKRDLNNELIFTKHIFAPSYVEENKGDVLFNMSDQDKKNYPNLAKGAEKIDEILDEQLSDDDFLNGSSELAKALIEYHNLETSKNKAGDEATLYTIQGLKDNHANTIRNILNISMSDSLVEELSKSYCRILEEIKDMDKQKEKIKNNAIENIKQEQERVLQKWELYDSKYATSESQEQYDTEVMNAKIILEIINKGKAEIEIDGGGKKVLTKDDLVDEEILELSIKTQKQLMVLYALQGSLAHAVLESGNYTSEIKTLQNKSKNNSNSTVFEKQMSIISDSLGLGGFWDLSDKRINQLSNIAETLIVQGALIAISGGLGSIGGSLFVRLLSNISGVARNLTMYTALAKTGKSFIDIWKMSKLTATTKALVGAAELVVNGSIFHMGHVVGSGIYQGDNLKTIIDNLDPSPKPKIGPDGELMRGENGEPIYTVFGEDYLHSIGFISVMHLFSPLIGQLNMKFNARSAANMSKSPYTIFDASGMPIKPKLSRFKKIGNAFKAEAITLPGEFAGMLMTEQTLSLIFDGKFQETTGESLLNTLTLIVGLRAAHVAIKLNKIKEKIDQKTFEKGAVEISDTDINKVLKSMEGTKSAVYINELAGPTDATVFQRSINTWSFAIKGKNGVVTFYNMEGVPMLEFVKRNVGNKSNTNTNQLQKRSNILDTENKLTPYEGKHDFVSSLGSELHEMWRKSRLKPDGTYEPRIKDVKEDAEWIKKHGTNQVDIANTKFEDLPSDWKKENQKAAEVAIDLVYESVIKGEKITPEMLEQMASKVHDEWLNRNKRAKDGELGKPYDKLPEIEKAKDRNQILKAIEIVGGKKVAFTEKEIIDNWQLTNELAYSNPNKYQEILIEKLSANPIYKSILEVMERTGTEIIINPELKSRGGYDKNTNTIEINPTRENRNDGSMRGEGGYGKLSGDQLTLAVVGHEMHHFLYENTLQKNRQTSANDIMNHNIESWGWYENTIVEIGMMLGDGKSFVYHTNTKDGIKAYRSHVILDSKGNPVLNSEGKTVQNEALNNYLVAEENVIELSRLYSQGQLEPYLQYLVNTEQAILDQKGLQKITVAEKAQIFDSIKQSVDRARNEFNTNNKVSVAKNNIDNMPSTNPKISPEVVTANAKLDPQARISKAKELVGKMNETQEKAILEAHNQDGVVLNLNFSQLRSRVEILSKAGFNSDQIRVLLENGICGKAEMKVLDVNKDGIFDTKDLEVMVDNSRSGKKEEIKIKKSGEKDMMFDRGDTKKRKISRVVTAEEQSQRDKEKVEWENKEKNKEQDFFQSLYLSGSGNGNAGKLSVYDIMKQNERKDRSLNTYRGVLLEKEVDYFQGNLNLGSNYFTYYKSNIETWFSHTEKFRLPGTLDRQVEEAISDIKIIMVNYGVNFDTAFLMYKIEFLKIHKSEFFSSTNNQEVKNFSERNGYNPDLLSKDDLILLRMFQTGASHSINKFKRESDTNVEQKNKANILQGTISSVIDKNQLKEPTTLYRIVYDDGVDVRKGKKVGDVVVDNGFVSTSFTDNFQNLESSRRPNSIILKINAPEGTSYINMGEHFSGGETVIKSVTYKYTGQDEIVLQSGTTSKITNIYTNKRGVPVYEVDIINPKISPEVVIANAKLDP